MPLDVIAPEDGKRGDVLIGENLHLIVADDHGDVRAMLIEIIGQLANRILVAIVPFPHDFGRNQVGEMRILAKGNHLVERVRFAVVEMPGLRDRRRPDPASTSGGIESMGPCEVPSPKVIFAMWLP